MTGMELLTMPVSENVIEANRTANFIVEISRLRFELLTGGLLDRERHIALYETIAEADKTSDWQKIADASLQIAGLNVPELEKAVALINAGTAFGHLGEIDRAVACIDEAIGLEQTHNRFFALENKATFLAKNGREREALEIYQALAERSDLYFGELDRMLQNIDTLKMNLAQ